MMATHPSFEISHHPTPMCGNCKHWDWSHGAVGVCTNPANYKCVDDYSVSPVVSTLDMHNCSLWERVSG